MADTQLRQPEKVAQFFDGVEQVAKDRPGESATLLKDNRLSVPTVVSGLLSRIDDKDNAHSIILDSVVKAKQGYRTKHGVDLAPESLEAMIQTAVNNTLPLDEITGKRFDSADSTHHDQMSLHPSNVIVSLMQMIDEAIPFAQYLPVDAKSNEGRLAILTPVAKSDFAEYTDGSPLNGVQGGFRYMMSDRTINMTTNGGGGSGSPLTFQVTALSTGSISAGNPVLPLLRGRTVLLVNGLPAAREAESYNANSGTNTIAGSVTIAGTSYSLSGTVNSDAGSASVVSTPALPAGVRVDARVYIDFERGPQYAPKIGMLAQVYKLFAHASRVLVNNTIDVYNQLQLELSVDPRSQSLAAVRSQYNQERFYGVLTLARLIAAQLTATWNYDWSNRSQQMNRATIFNDFAPIVAALSQQMANNTTDHGISHLFFTGKLSAQVRGLPNTIFESSGISNQPGIYRMGRLFGLYECYYTPRGLAESADGATSEVLCIGQSQQTARNPFVLGDVVNGMFLPIAMNQDLVYRDAFYTKGFTELNPHPPSAQSAALIQVTNITN